MQLYEYLSQDNILGVLIDEEVWYVAFEQVPDHPANIDKIQMRLGLEYFDLTDYAPIGECNVYTEISEISDMVEDYLKTIEYENSRSGRDDSHSVK